MGDDITIGVTEIVNNIEVTAQPNDQIVDINVTDNSENVTLNITPTVIEINVNKGSSYARWGSILGTLTDQTDLANALILKADLIDGLVPSYQLPSYVDDVIEVANYAALPASGEAGKIYITLDTNRIYRWSGSTYIEITDNTAVWGAITGTLSSQTDLVNALNLRVPYTGATSNVNLGEYGLTGGFLALDTTPTSTPTGIGTIYWDSGNRTAALIDGDGDTTLQIGQEQRILVHNNTGSTLTDGQVVYVTGSTGNLPSVSLANASSETTSAATLGVVTESIANGADGFITTSGIVNGLNTLAFNEGDLLWLGTTAGTFTATKPISPNHLVLIGYVIKKAGGNGSILVKIQNTQELEESSDVLFTSLTNKDFLVYESSTDLWKNKSLGTVLAGTSSQFVKGDGSLDSTAYVPTARTLTINGTVYDLTADRSWTIATHNPVGIGTSNGLSIDSNQQLSLALASTSTNGSLSSTDWNTFNGKQNALTNPITGTGTTNYLPKFTGTSAIGNSLIYDNGTNIGIGTTSPSYKLDVAGVGRFLGSIPLTLERSGSTKYTFSLGASDDFYINNVNIGTTPLTILSSGNVGIGTTTPNYSATNRRVLDINGTSQSMLALSVGGVGKSFLFYTGTDLLVSNESNGAIKFNTNGSEKAIITSGGDVGIGTTSPAAKLDVNGIFRSIVTSISSTGEIAAKILGYPTSPFGLIFRSYSSGATSIQSQRESSNSELFPLSLQPLGGNVGIGTTSPAQKLDVFGTSRISNTTPTQEFYSTGNGDVWGSVYAQASGTGSGASLVFSTKRDGNTATDKMIITQLGSVGIGTTSPNSNSNRTTLTLNNNTWGGQLDINVGGVNHAQFGTDNFNSGLSCRIQSQDGIVFNAGGASEKMRITSDGKLIIGTSSSIGSGIFQVKTSSANNVAHFQNGTSDAGYGLVFLNVAGSAVGSIGWTNVMTSYNVTSDYRLKEDFKDYSGLDLISKIKTYDYKWKQSEDRMYGVKAHELQEIVPYAVTGEKDAEQMQSVDYSKLVPILVQAIQEQQKQIDELKKLINK